MKSSEDRLVKRSQWRPVQIDYEDLPVKINNLSDRQQEIISLNNPN